MNIVNLTPHPIELYGDDSETLLWSIPPSGTVARVSEVVGADYFTNGMPVPFRTAPTYGEVTGLPDYAAGTFYIVSSMVGQAVCRDDLLSPSNADMVRDAAGRILGTRRLVRWGEKRLWQLVEAVRNAGSISQAAALIEAAGLPDEWLARCILYESDDMVLQAWWDAALNI